MASNQLRIIGLGITKSFDWLAAQDTAIPRTDITIESERFKIWAHSLGLHQGGHASLDYRLRDSVPIQELCLELLKDLQEQLGNLTSIARGDRPPVEEQRFQASERAPGDSDKASDSSQTSTESHGSIGSFKEINYRVASLKEALDTLYSLATKIRKPNHRPQRTIHQLCKHTPADAREHFIHDGEQTEARVVSYMLYKQLIDGFHPKESDTEIIRLFQTYTSTDRWLIQRTGAANFRRKQQFIYWEEHARRLSRPQTPSHVPQRKANLNPAGAESAPISSPSIGASATPIDPNSIKPDDLRSDVTQQSRASTLIGPRGERISYPRPPDMPQRGRYFFCPYCKIWCPVRYLNANSAKNSKLGKDNKLWENHVDHDLQPYHCTYKDCNDSGRLYGKQQEWIGHERQHRHVWHCQHHGEEFETQSDYELHLRRAHPSASPEQFSQDLITSAVGPSVHARRDCPFCSSPFSDVPSMVKHVAYHLKRLAFVCMPIVEDNRSDTTTHRRSSESHAVQRNWRDGSISDDFDEEENASFAEIKASMDNHGHTSELKTSKLQDAFFQGRNYDINQWLGDVNDSLLYSVDYTSPLPEEYQAERENHIKNERERRTVMKEGFDDLQEIVPKLKNGGYSKSTILQLAGEWLDDILKGNELLSR